MDFAGNFWGAVMDVAAYLLTVGVSLAVEHVSVS
jgi:hypothetical protein